MEGKKFDTNVKTHEEREIEAEKLRVIREEKEKKDKEFLDRCIWVEGLLMPRTKTEFS